MEVGPGDGYQIQGLGPTAPASAEVGVDPRPGNFDRAKAPIGQAFQRRLAEIIRRVRQRGDATGGDRQGDGLGPVQSRLGHLGRAAIAEESGKGVPGAGDLTGPHEPVGQVAAAERRAGEDTLQRREIHRKPERAQPIGHRRESFDAAGSNSGRRGEHARIIVADKVAEDMDFSTVQLGRPLDATDQLKAQSKCLGPGDGQGRDRIMIGDRQRREANG